MNTIQNAPALREALAFAEEVAARRNVSLYAQDLAVRAHSLMADLRAALQSPAVQPAVAVQEAPEATFERYVADLISKAPDPLRELGDYLSRVLDEDEWPAAERYVLAAMRATPAVHAHIADERKSWSDASAHDKEIAGLVLDCLAHRLTCRTPPPAAPTEQAAPQAEAKTTTEPVCEVLVGGLAPWGKAAVFKQWLAGKEDLTDGVHKLYLHPSAPTGAQAEPPPEWSDPFEYSEQRIAEAQGFQGATGAQAEPVAADTLTERAMFEAQFSRFDLRPSIRVGHYADLRVQFMWEAWDARAALSASPARAIPEQAAPRAEPGICPDCGGSGLVSLSGFEADCKVCNGTGKLAARNAQGKSHD